MKTNSSYLTPRGTSSTLLWVGAGAIVFALASFTLSLPPAKVSVQGAGSHHTTTPAATELNHIDHGESDWDKYPATPGNFGTSVAAYGFGA